MKETAVIGAGIGGLATAIRLAIAGHTVHLFESNNHAGGKINKLQLGDYRFDMGPSVFTAPEYIKELFELCKEDFSQFEYEKLSCPFHYFFPDGQKIIVPDTAEEIGICFEKELGEDKNTVINYLNKASVNYKRITPLFIERSLHRWRHLLTNKLIAALWGIPKYRLSKTMHEENKSVFKHSKTHQIFNRFATYNGSDPYQAPAMLNMIQHLEMVDGVFLPKKGMVQIADALYELAKKQGVHFYFNEPVERIHLVENKNRIKGLTTNKKKYRFDAIFSNMDVSYTYEKLMPEAPRPEKILNQEKSSSAMVFYWGIKEQFPELGVHNMFFSDNYKAEFDAIFKTKTLAADPSIYVHITAKNIRTDAPTGKENWFVMINVPINNDQNWEDYRQKAKKTIIKTLSKALKKDISPLIEEEFVMDPVYIDKKYNGKFGSIYGNASNNKFSAFYRHPNYSKKIKGLYFAGVTVHPGGGIPLALNSAKIAVKCFQEDL